MKQTGGAGPAMMNKRPLWLEALAQVIVGPRGLLKMGQIWLPLALILVTGTRLAPGARLACSLYLLCAVLSKGLSGILINDLTDREIDSRAGKNRWITSVPAPAGVTIAVLLVAIGYLALVRGGGGAAALLSFTATVLLGILYSLKPVRFKERGGWGVLAYVLSASILHALVPWTVFRPPWWLLPALLLAIAGDKLVQILFHQIVDFESDREDQVKSFAVKVGRGKAEQLLRLILPVVVGVDAALLIYLLFIVRESPIIFWLVCLASILGLGGAGLYSGILSRKLGTTSELTERLPWTYLGISYLLFYGLPPLLYLSLACTEPEMSVLAAFSVLSLLGMSINFFHYRHK
jgi:4-hydroxybenzoate polyprenyltransferase